MSTSVIAGVEGYGFPTPQTAQRAYDDTDLVRAITVHWFFFPSVSALSIYKGNVASGMVPGLERLCPLRRGYRPDSDKREAY
jgi:hypothetical protein